MTGFAFVPMSRNGYRIDNVSRGNEKSGFDPQTSDQTLNIKPYLMITRFIIAAAVALFFAPVMPVVAQEHPEHPKKAAETPKKSEHPEHPKKSGGKEVTTAEISAGIKKHIATETKKSSDKKFHADYEGKDLALDLVKVHDNRLSSLGEGKYFACVDMKATDGTTYDIDFFMSGKPGDMKVTETSVHKINGKPLYNWKEENGTWKKVSL
jgi:hypothetical protein